MKSGFLASLTAALISAAVPNTHAQAPSPVPPVTPEALAVEATENNPELAFYDAEIEAARGLRREAGRPRNPQLSAGIGGMWSESQQGMATGDGPAWSVALSQPIEWPGRLALRKAIANQDIEIAVVGRDQFRATVAARTVALAYSLHAAQQLAQAAEEVATRFESLVAVSIQRDPGGPAPLLERRILEANGITHRHRASMAHRRAQEILLQLNLILGRPLPESCTIQADRPGFRPAPSLETLLTSAFTHNFELRQHRIELEQQGFRVDLARNERYPTISVGPYYSEETSSGTDRFAGIGITVPLPVWNRNSGAITAARARRDQAATALDTTRREVESEVVRTRNAFETHRREMEFWAEDAIRSFQEAAAAADRHYRLGAVPVTTYVEMQKQALDALQTMLETRNETIEAARNLELAVGQPLGLVGAASSPAPDNR